MRALACCLPLLAASTPALAQSRLSTLRGNFAVPDAPAAKLLSVDPAKIVRPGNTQDLAATFGSFGSDDGGFQIPSLFAVQAAPFLILNPMLSLQTYQKTPWLYRLRLSMATSHTKADSGFTRMALGFSTSIRDDADPRTSDVVRDIDRQLFVEDSIRKKYEVDLVKERPDEVERRCLRFGTCGGVNLAALALKLGLSTAEIECLLAAGACGEPRRLTFRQTNYTRVHRIEAERDSVLRASNVNATIDSIATLLPPWNATVLNVAGGWSVASLDSTGRGARNERFGLWGTWGFPMGADAQGLLGLLGSRRRNVKTNSWSNGITLSGRAYVGTNERKVFFEGQGTGAEHSLPEWVMGLGAELQVTSGIWIEASVRWQSTGSISAGRIVPGFSILTGQAGKKKPEAEPAS